MRSAYGGTASGPRWQVRPWALFPAGCDKPASVRLVSHRRVALPLSRVAGLAKLVGDLPVHTQAMALAWCDANGAPSIEAIAAAGEAAAFVEAAGLSSFHHPTAAASRVGLPRVPVQL